MCGGIFVQNALEGDEKPLSLLRPGGESQCESGGGKGDARFWQFDFSLAGRNVEILQNRSQNCERETLHQFGADASSFS